MRVIVDTNILFSAILNSQSWIGQILLHSDKTTKFYSPKYLQVEIDKHFNKIKSITKLSDNEIHELIDALYTKIHFISEELISKDVIIVADQLTNDIDFDDVMFIALAIHFNCKLWTGDKALMNALRKKGFKKFVTTDDLKKRLRK
jgi:predicted nucleic acid-binding protein